MEETTLQLIAILKLLFIVIYAACYAFGGMKGKWKRRILGSILLTSAIAGFSLWQGTFSFWYLSCALFLFGSTSMGYGADRLVEKLWKRFYCGLAYSLIALPMAIVHNNWAMFILNIILCLSVSIILGVWNPCRNARDEETMMGVVVSFIPIFMA